jgi:GT2 family glycosyltransferase
MYVVGNGMVFRSSCMKSTDGYDERLFWGGEEFDLALELMRCNIPIAFREDLQIVHLHATQAHSSIRAHELDMRNNMWIAVGRFPLSLVLPYGSLLILRRVMMAALKRDAVRIRGYLRGLRSGMVGLVSAFRSRRPVLYRQLLRHRRWAVGLLFAPRAYARSVKRAMQKPPQQEHT